MSEFGTQVSSVSPRGQRILLKPVESPTTTPSGLVSIPEGEVANDTPIGLVVEVGHDPFAKDTLIPCFTGEHVMYVKHSGSKVSIAGVDHLVVRYSDVLAVVLLEESRVEAPVDTKAGI
jgi:chaperonin GroES